MDMPHLPPPEVWAWARGWATSGNGPWGKRCSWLQASLRLSSCTELLEGDPPFHQDILEKLVILLATIPVTQRNAQRQDIAGCPPSSHFPFLCYEDSLFV